MPKGSSKTGGPARRYLGAEWRFTRHLLEMGDLANNPGLCRLLGESRAQVLGEAQAKARCDLFGGGAMHQGWGAYHCGLVGAPPLDATAA